MEKAKVLFRKLLRTLITIEGTNAKVMLTLRRSITESITVLRSRRRAVAL